MILLDQAGAGTGGSSFFPPLRSQEPFIEHFWIQQPHAAPVGRSWRIIPDANPYLIFVVSRRNSRIQVRCDLIGPRSRFADVTMGNRILTCGARLRPGALPLLTGFPASDFTDRSVPVEAVFGAQGRSMTERCGESCSPHRALDEMARF